MNRKNERERLLWKFARPLYALYGILLAVCLMLPHDAEAQNLSEKRITVTLKHASLNEFFTVMKDKTGLNFMLTSSEDFKPLRITVNQRNQPVRVILDTVMRQIGCRYTIDNGFVIINKLETAKPRRITGTVCDVEQQPLPGAVIRLKSGGMAAVADADGHYSVYVPTSHCTLIFSFVGMDKQEVHIAAGSAPVTKNIMLRSNTDLEDVVVTGYQELDKSRIAGSVAVVKSKDLDLNGINSLEQALQGKVAGVAIQNQSGLVGMRQKTRVRGTSTMMGSQEPIWVVDGIIQEDPLPFSTQQLDALGGINDGNWDYVRQFVGNSISWLNPNDIDNITILKDASATAIYGVRAANGVIVIKTKRGKRGNLSVSYSGGFNIGEKVDYSRLELMNSKQRVAVSREIFDRGLSASWTNNNIGYAGALNRYLLKQITAEEFDAEVAKLESTNTDWFNLLYRNPLSHNHNLSFSGGGENVRYYASLGYNSTMGTARGNDSQAYNAHVGLNMDFSRKLHVSFDLSGSTTTTDAFYLVDPYNYASTTNRAIPAYNPDGSLYFYQEGGNYYNYNILNELANTGNRNKNLGINTSINVNYDIMEGLRLQTLFAYNTSKVSGETYATERSNYITRKRGYEYGTVLPTDPRYKNSPLPVGGEYNTSTTNQESWNWRNSLSYDHVFAGVHSLTAMLGVEMSSTKYDGYSGRMYGYLRDRGRSFAEVPPMLTYINGNYTSYRENELLKELQPKITDTKTNNMGIYLTLNYAYDNRYVVNASVRGDASNRFGRYHNENFNPVWAGGFRWNMYREKWFSRQNIFSNVSISASYGFQRNMDSSYSSDLILKVPSISSLAVDQNTGDYLLQISRLAYNDLRWEKTFSQNYGIEMGLFHDKIRLSAEYYNKRGTDMIYALSVPVEYGIENMPVNGASMNNSGFELSVGFTPIRTKDFTWDVSANTAKNWNKVTKVETQNNTWSNAVSGSYFKQGYAQSSFWAFKYDGIDPKTGYPIIDLSVKDGSDPANDPTAYMTYAGKLDPDLTGGLSMSFRYKMLSLSTSFYWQLGGKKFLSKAYPSTILPSEYDNLSTELLNRWTPENTTAQFPGLPDIWIYKNAQMLPSGKQNDALNLYEMYNYSTARVVSASTLRCNNLSLSYTFAESLIKALHLQALSLNASVSNLFSIVSKDFHGRDAEVATGQQPRTRSYSFTLSATF